MPLMEAVEIFNDRWLYRCRFCGHETPVHAVPKREFVTLAVPYCDCPQSKGASDSAEPRFDMAAILEGHGRAK